MLEILDRILELLSIGDGARSAAEISILTGLKPAQVENAFKLLDSIEFVSFDGERATIDPAVRQLILLNVGEGGDG